MNRRPYDRWPIELKSKKTVVDEGFFGGRWRWNQIKAPPKKWNPDLVDPDLRRSRWKSICRRTIFVFEDEISDQYRKLQADIDKGYRGWRSYAELVAIRERLKKKRCQGDLERSRHRL